MKMLTKIKRLTCCVSSDIELGDDLIIFTGCPVIAEVIMPLKVFPEDCINFIIWGCPISNEKKHTIFNENLYFINRNIIN